MLMFDKIIGFVMSSILKKSIAYRSRTRIRFKNGSWIIALPCGLRGYSIRGHSAHLAILDEAAFIPGEVIMKVVLPMVSATDGSVWMISTPYDRNHVFYRCFMNTGEWSVYHLPSSVNPFIKPEFLEEQKELIGEERFMIEYEALFIDDSKAYFPMTLIRPCIKDYELKLEGSDNFGGYDPGGRESYAAFVLVKRFDQKLKVCYLHQEKGRSYTDFNAEIADFKQNTEKMLVDQTGLGAPILEHLKELGLNVEGAVLTDRQKEELFTNMKILFEQHKIIIPHNLDLINSLNCVEYERTRVGGYRFTHRNGTYDDLAHALALACYAAKESGILIRV